MAELLPQPLGFLLRRMAHELSRGACFDLPARSFHRAPRDLDFGVLFHGERAANALGPAAGPQSQLAQNIVLSYLAGGRIFELKTVQVNDALVIPRPCIDATNVGYNVEWSQELKLEESLLEYVKAWVLLHSLRKADLDLGLAGPAGDFIFDMSVGYDLRGIQTAGVRGFLDGMLNARSQIDACLAEWPDDLQAWRPDRAQIRDRLSASITLSTFHGCPADEIERICDHLISDVGAHVVVKLNPTLLGYDSVCETLNGSLGYDAIRPHREAFETDLQWNEALQLVRRLKSRASAQGLNFGVKFSNTLVVENHRDFFPATEKVMYLSGQPLHVLSFELALKFREAFGETLPISFSAGVDSKNFADCVAAGFVPVTTCTDLLRPGGYGRLPKYLDALGARMRAKGVSRVADFIAAESGNAEEAELANHRAAAAKLATDPRYHARQNSSIPKRVGTRLWLFDCISCDKCIPVCPNDANFAVEVPAALCDEVTLRDLVLVGGVLTDGRARSFKLKDGHQIANYADFCNECGNCDVFCPEEGGPFIVKPRFFANRERMLAAPPGLDGFVIERAPTGDLIEGRHEGRHVSLQLSPDRTRARFIDEAMEVELDNPGLSNATLVKTHSSALDGHTLRRDLVRALSALLEGVLSSGSVSPVSAPFLAPVAPPRTFTPSQT